MDVLVMGAGFGGGHNQAGHAAVEALQAAGVESTAFFDYLAGFPASLAHAGTTGYAAVTKYWPRAYGVLHAWSGHWAPRPAWNEWVGALGQDALAQALQAMRPHVLILTHPWPATVIARWCRDGIDTPRTILVATDFEPHPQWVQPGLDYYCAASEMAAGRWSRAGIDARRIRVTGIPIRRPFWTAGDDAPSPRPTVPTVLVLGSALGGLSRLPALCRRLLLSAPTARIVVVAGQDRLLYLNLAQLARRRGGRRLEVHGYVPDVSGFMRDAHVIVSKAGGLSVSEALACRRPLVIYRPIPGHEADTARWLGETGAAVVTEKPAEAANAVATLLAVPGDRARLAQAAGRLARPDAAHRVAELAVALLTTRASEAVNHPMQ